MAPVQPPEEFMARLSALAPSRASSPARFGEMCPTSSVWSEPHSGAMGASPTERAGSLMQVATAPESGALQRFRAMLGWLGGAGVSGSRPLGPQFLKWLVPAGALAAALVVVLRVVPSQNIKPAVSPSAVPGILKADDVQIDHELVSTFDAVAQLPSGPPVRFHCREWMDQVVLDDSKRGITVTERRPRVEIIPVGYETY